MIINVENFEQFKDALNTTNNIIQLKPNCIITFTESINLKTNRTNNRIYGNNATIFLGEHKFIFRGWHIENCIFKAPGSNATEFPNYNFDDNNARLSLIIDSSSTNGEGVIGTNDAAPNSVKDCEFYVKDIHSICAKLITGCKFVYGFCVCQTPSSSEVVLLMKNNTILCHILLNCGFDNIFKDNFCFYAYIAVAGGCNGVDFSNNTSYYTFITFGYRGYQPMGGCERVTFKNNTIYSGNITMYTKDVRSKTGITLKDNTFLGANNIVNIFPNKIIYKVNGEVVDNSRGKRIYTLSKMEIDALDNYNDLVINQPENSVHTIEFIENRSNTGFGGSSFYTIINTYGGYDNLIIDNNSYILFGFLPTYYCENIYIKNNNNMILSIQDSCGPSFGKPLKKLSIKNNSLSQDNINQLKQITSGIEILELKDNDIKLNNGSDAKVNIENCIHIIKGNTVYSNMDSVFINNYNTTNTEDRRFFSICKDNLILNLK